MKKIIALVLVVIGILTLTSCSKEIYYREGNLNLGFNHYRDVNLRIKSDKFVFDKNNVTLDVSYGLYCLHGAETLEMKKKQHFITQVLQNGEEHCFELEFAIYISYEEDLVFEKNDKYELIDYENNVNATLLKYISYEEAFSTNYGFTWHVVYGQEYNHSEKITIPSELFTESNDCIYIHVVTIRHNINEDTYYASESDDRRSNVRMNYMMTGDIVVLQ